MKIKSTLMVMLVASALAMVITACGSSTAELTATPAYNRQATQTAFMDERRVPPAELTATAETMDVSRARRKATSEAIEHRHPNPSYRKPTSVPVIEERIAKAEQRVKALGRRIENGDCFIDTADMWFMEGDEQYIKDKITRIHRWNDADFRTFAWEIEEIADRWEGYCQ